LELLPVLEARQEQPTVLAGTSSGAINAVTLTGLLHRPVEEIAGEAVRRWRDVVAENVFGSIPVAQIPSLALRYAGSILGLPGMEVPSLFDPAPLRHHLPRWLDLPQVHANLEAGLVEHVAVVATEARTGRPTAFVAGRDANVGPDDAVFYVPATLDSTHVRASAAVPVLFPSVRVDAPAEAAGWYLDGSVRLSSSVPVVRHLGAERIVVIGVSSGPPARSAPVPAITGRRSRTRSPRSSRASSPTGSRPTSNRWRATACRTSR
jgi:NTE family protein